MLLPSSFHTFHLWITFSLLAVATIVFSGCCRKQVIILLIFRINKTMGSFSPSTWETVAKLLVYFYLEYLMGWFNNKPQNDDKKTFSPPTTRKKIPNQPGTGIHRVWFVQWPENKAHFSAVHFHPVSPSNTLWLLTNGLTSAGRVGHWWTWDWILPGLWKCIRLFHSSTDSCR